MSEAILFDRDKVEKLDDFGERPRRLRGGRLLWVDVDRCSEDEAHRVRRGVRARQRNASVPRRLKGPRSLQGSRPLHPRHHLRAARRRGGRADRARVRRRRELGGHRPRPADPRARRVRRRESPAPATPARSTARASSPRCSNGCSAPTPRRSSGSSSGWRSSTSRRCAATPRLPTTSSG